MQRYDRKLVDRHVGPARRTRSWLALLVVGLLCGPLLLDGARLTHAQWATLYGPKPVVNTPALDLVESYAERTTTELRRLSKRPFRKLPWRVEWAVSGLAFSLIAGGLILRYSRLR